MTTKQDVTEDEVTKKSKRLSSREDLPQQRVYRQRELVETMRNDNEITRLDLTKESRDARKSTSSAAAADIARLQEQAAMYIKKIESEKQKITSLDAEIEIKQKEIVDQKAKLGGVNAAQINNQIIQRKIKEKENSMDKYLMKFNETMAQNKVLRQRIDEYRRERVVFDGIYKKLERELHEKKKEMASIIDDSKNAYQAREASQAEMITLQQHSEKERKEYEAVYRQLGETIKKQQEMLEKIRLQQFDRNFTTKAGSTVDSRKLLTTGGINGSTDSPTKALNSSGGNDKPNASPSTREPLRSPKQSTAMLHSHTSKLAAGAIGGSGVGGNGAGGATNISNPLAGIGNGANIIGADGAIHNYDDALNKIREATGIHDVQEIVSRFLEAEEQNFSLFNYVNDTNSDIEKLEHSIADMRNMIEKCKGQGANTDTQRKKALRTLEERLKRTEEKTQEYIDRHNKAVKVINVLKNGIHSIFTRIGAASTSVEEMLGNQGVTESNMMQYLGIIEQRTSEILQAYASSQVGLPTDQAMQLPIITVSNDLNATKLSIQPPSCDGNLSDEDDADSANGGLEQLDDRPLTRQELDVRTSKEIQRKANNSNNVVSEANILSRVNLSSPNDSNAGGNRRPGNYATDLD